MTAKNDYPQLRAFLKGLRTQAAQEAFAHQCETSLNYLRKAMSKGSRMDVKLVEKIVVNSGFQVAPDELRSDVDWSVFQLEHAARKIARPKRAAPPRARKARGEHGAASTASTVP